MNRLGLFALLVALSLLAFCGVIVGEVSTYLLDPIFEWIGDNPFALILGFFAAWLVGLCVWICSPLTSRRSEVSRPQPALARRSLRSSGSPIRTSRRHGRGARSLRPVTRSGSSSRAAHPSQGLGGHWR